MGAEISSGKSPGFQVESLRKLAAIFVSFRVLSCRMLPLEDRINQKAFRVALVSTRPLQVAEDAAAICRSTCTTKPTASPIAASVSQKLEWAWLRMTRLAKLRRAFSAELA